MLSRLDNIRHTGSGVEGGKKEIMKTINDIELIMTCGACPEQYDAFIDDEQVGYLRLRHGRFTVEYPDVRGRLVYSVSPEGDGIFEDQEREKYLTAAKEAILKEYLQTLTPHSNNQHAKQIPGRFRN